MSTPSPGSGLKRAAWSDPTVKAEFAAWTDRLNGLGWPIDQSTLEDRAWDFAVGYDRARDKLLTPFDPYLKYTGARQSWRMFVAPHRYPTRLWVELEEDGAWRPIYVERSSEHTWMGYQLDHDRFRSAIFRYGWPQFRSSYKQFAEWLASRAARDFPEATQLRTRMYKYRTASPDEVREDRMPEGRFQMEVVVPLAPLREGAP